MANEYEAMVDTSEARLWEMIGDAVLEGPDAARYRAAAAGLGARQTRGERARAAADAWFLRNRDTLHDAICGNAAVRKAFSSDPGATIEIARAVGDAIASLHLFVPVPTIAMLVARKGLDWICGEPS
jgi:hypothetical protein